jgi:hypothetical protein
MVNREFMLVLFEGANLSIKIGNDNFVSQIKLRSSSVKRPFEIALMNLKSNFSI